MHTSRIWQLVYLSSVIFIVRNTDSYCLKMNYVQQRANLKQNTPMTKLLGPEPVNLLALLPQAQIVASRGSWQPGQLSPNLSWPYYRCSLRVDRIEAAFGTATKRTTCQEIRLAVQPFLKSGWCPMLLPCRYGPMRRNSLRPTALRQRTRNCLLFASLTFKITKIRK